MLTREQMELLQKIESLQDDGSEGYPFSQEELDLIVSSLRALEKDAEKAKSALAEAYKAIRDAVDGVGIDREGDTHDWEVMHATIIKESRK